MVAPKIASLALLFLANIQGRAKNEHFQPRSTYITTQQKNPFWNIQIQVTTFNVGGITPPSPEINRNWLALNYVDPPDIVVIGLQEVVELSVSNLPMSKPKKEKWLRALTNTIPSNYDRIGKTSLFGILLAVYKKRNSTFVVKEVQTHRVPTGILDLIGNKGAAGISLKVNNISLCIINSHLAAGEKEVQERNKDFQQIVRKMKFKGKDSIYHHDAIFWSGDMNSRLNVEKSEDNLNAIRKACKIGACPEYFKYDQLRTEKTAGNMFYEFNETDPKFRPTYKYDVGLDRFDTSIKQRFPAWTDRILYWTNPRSTVGIEQVSYDSIQNVKLSDHRPVKAIFKLFLTA